MTGHGHVAERSAQPTVSIRTRTSVRDLGNVLRKAYGTIKQYLENAGRRPAGPPDAAYFNPDREDLDVEIGFPVSVPLPGREDISPGELPGGRFAACLYMGPYSKIGSAYESLSQWMKAQGHVPGGAAFELYLNDPATIAPKDRETMILYDRRGDVSPRQRLRSKVTQWQRVWHAEPSGVSGGG
jgi:effector-binding domain-containing protein